MSETAATGTYDAYYYNHCCGPDPYDHANIRNFFEGIARRIVEDIRPRKVMDAGCALGFLVAGLRRRGVEAYGFDVSEYAIDHCDPDARPYCRVGSILEPFDGHYDLIVCQEVLEHLHPHEAQRAVENLCRHGDEVLFSSTPFDYKEASHFNVQPAEYWAKLFARYDFYRDVDFDADFITPWAVRFRRAAGPAPCAIAAYERRLTQLMTESRAQRQLNLEQQNELAGLERSVHQQAAAEALLRGRLTEAERLLTEKERLLRTITDSRAWRAVQLLRRVRAAVAPQGSRRARLLRTVWHAARALRRGGRSRGGAALGRTA